MAITNAQQFKQLVNPPMEGKKRPGYRGEAAAASDRAEGRNAGRDTSDAGTGNVGGDFNRGSFRDAVTQGQLRDLAKRQAEDKLEEALEVFRNRNRGSNFVNKALNFIPGIGAVRRIASTFGPINNRDFFLDRVAPKNFSSLPTSMQQNMFDQYMSARGRNEIDAYGNPIDTDNDNNILLPQTTFAQAPSSMDQETETEEPQGLGGLRLAYRADGGPIGGEYDFESARQMYGLGKLVKKVTRTVKKIAKSPVGKAALLYTGAAMAGSYGSGQGLFSKGMFNPGNIARGILGTKGIGMDGGTQGLLGKLKLTEGFGAIKPTVLGGITAASALAGALTPAQEEEAQTLATEEGIDIEAARNSILARAQGNIRDDFRARAFVAEGGKPEPVAKKTMPLLDMGGQEMDLRAEGGFVPIGRMEKADDVPARLSKNEFVFTADAVRNAGEGNVDKGAEVMYNMMKNLEAGGEVSEESQGLEGARRMFQTSQRLEEVL